MRAGDLVGTGLFTFFFYFSNNFLPDTELEARLDQMEEGDEFEPDKLQGGLVFSEDEENLVNHEEKDDW